MQNQNDPDQLKIPAFMRKKAIVSQAKQRLILTALDRKEAGLRPNSKKALAPVKPKLRKTRTSNFIKKTPQVRTSNSLSEFNGNNYSNSLLEDFNEPNIGGYYRNESTNRISDLQRPNEQFSQFNTAQDLPPKMVCIGTITEYLTKINVAIIMLSGTLKQGDIIAITGENFLSFQKVEEIQIDREPVPLAQKGDHIGLKVNEPAQTNGKIYRFQY